MPGTDRSTNEGWRAGQPSEAASDGYAAGRAAGPGFPAARLLPTLGAVTWVVPLALVGLAVTVMAVFTVIAGRRGRHPHQPSSTGPGPRILVHDINDDRCTGCDACVAVCPTNVLDLVDNKSRVLRFHDCIQCEACMWACPTEALVMFPEGTQPPALRVPELDASYQTAVPGQYLIGEVAGKPLVKNAANLGRAVIEHMLATGLRPGAFGPQAGPHQVDVAIVGSGPGGLSAALSCIQRGLTYVLLEKEQLIASTINRYPKGKLVMAEPYDTVNLSLLPVFDSSKEQIVPIWRELIERVGVAVKLGEAVESVTLQADRSFDVRTTVAAYRAQRIVLATGTRGKPRTLQVPGENLPKVSNLLDDPDEWRGREVLVVGGGDSAVEAALALADAGARVIITYRGKSFNRAQPKNKQAIESYAQQQRLKVKYGSQVLGFEPEAVTLQLADGAQKRYANHAAFVLIGADPPVTWLEKLGVRFVLRPHQYALGKTDDLIRRLVRDPAECPQDAATAAAMITGRAPERLPTAPTPPPPSGLEPVSGPRKWVRAATNLISGGHLREGTGVGSGRGGGGLGGGGGGTGTGSKRIDAPMPLSEFAKRQRTNVGAPRDALSAGERTRVLRMLRDEGGRIADEDSRVAFIDMAAMKRSGGRLHEDTPEPEIRDLREPRGLPGVAPLHLPGSPPPRPLRPGAAMGEDTPLPEAMVAPSAPIRQVPMAPPPQRSRAAPNTAPPPNVQQVPRPPAAGAAGDIVAKPAVIVGLAQAHASGPRGRGRADEIELGPGVRMKPGRAPRPEPVVEPVDAIEPMVDEPMWPTPAPELPFAEERTRQHDPMRGLERPQPRPLRRGPAVASVASVAPPAAKGPTGPVAPTARQAFIASAPTRMNTDFGVEVPTRAAPVDPRILARAASGADDGDPFADPTRAVAAFAPPGDLDKTTAGFDVRMMAEHVAHDPDFDDEVAHDRYGPDDRDDDDDDDADVLSATRGHGATGAIDLGPRDQSRRYPRLDDETPVVDAADTSERGPFRRGRPPAADEATRTIGAVRGRRDWENE